jgi:DNA-packaging protein gp3
MGLHKNIESPEQLWKYFCDYIEHERNNPMYRRDYVGKDGEEKDTPLQVPITFEGFECYLWDKDVISDLKDYASNKQERYTEFAPIITRIRQNCFSQNFKGAAVGLFNANLIARKLGISDKQETDITSKGKEIEYNVTLNLQ